jgi:hypothetical protein
MSAVLPPPPTRSTSPDEHRRRGREGGRVLVLNATYEPINVCTVRRAIVLMLKAKAEVLEEAEWSLHAERFALRAAVRDPPDELRARAARRAPAKDHPAGGVRARRLDLPVLRLARQPDRRPRDPALEGRPVELGQHRRLVRPVQSPQGRPHPGPVRTCTRRAPRASRTPRSSSACPARRSRRLGARTCPPRPERAHLRTRSRRREGAPWDALSLD